MFVNYRLENIKNNKVDLNQENILDIKSIIECFEMEGFQLSNWSLFEIAKSEDKNVYGFESLNKNLVYMKISNKRKVTPHYFKNHGLDEYSEFQAESIREAIEKYENFYTCNY